jgi:2-polyprenyl-3-methyl-5-hydroxy-6-metoxy-1,4-benzoquinol methylase
LASPFLQRRRIAAALPYIRGQVLDVGCGNGALAEFVSPAQYRGVDRDSESLSIARRRFPAHVFTEEVPSPEERFDTVAALAVIEHVTDPASFLYGLLNRLAASPDAVVVVTTPHPVFGWVHALGSRIGIFSRHGAEEHQPLLGRPQLNAIAAACGVAPPQYRRFLLGANQLAVYRRP